MKPAQVTAVETVNTKRKLAAVATVVAEKEETARKLFGMKNVRIAPFRNFKNQIVPGKFGVFADDGLCVGEYAKKEHLVPNLTLVETFRAVLTSLGHTFTENIWTTNGGGQMHALFTIGGTSFAGPDGKEINLRIRLVNSYDGSAKIQVRIEALRLVCLNGMVGFSEFFALFKRHMGDFILGDLLATVRPEIESGSRRFVGQFQRFADVKLSDEQGNFVLRNMFLASPMKFSGLMARKIESAWNSPAEDEKETHNTLWGLYNAGTRVFRDLEQTKTALFEKSATHFTGALIGATEKPEWFNRLIAPIDSEKAYARETAEA